MRQVRRLLLGAMAITAAAAAGGVGARVSAAARGPAAERSRIEARESARGAGPRLPISFEENRGQTDGDVRFLARAAGCALGITDTGAVFVGGGERRDCVRMSVENATPGHAIRGEGALAGRSNYLRGKDAARWIRDVPHFASVRCESVLPGIDERWSVREGRVEYEFIVSAEADADAIALRFDGASAIGLSEDGALVLRTRNGAFRQTTPVAYEELDGGGRRAVAVRFALRENGRVGFDLGRRDGRSPIVIDPATDYATYLGGPGDDQLHGVALGKSGSADEGSVYVTGVTYSGGFPTTSSALEATYRGGGTDAFVAKLTADGSALVFATYLGGTNDDEGDAVALDGSGIYVSGITVSSDFPTTGLQTTLGGQSAFLTKLDPSGASIVYSTYLGGNNGTKTYPGCLAVDGAGRACITGATDATDYPVTAGAYDNSCGTSGFCSVEGASLFVTVVATDGASLAYSTYFGGTGADYATALAVDGTGAVYVVGVTAATDLPMKNAYSTTPAYSFMAKFDPAQSGEASLVFSTYLDAVVTLDIGGIAVDKSGSAYVVGAAAGTGLPAVHAYQPAYGGGPYDAVVMKFVPAGNALAYATYLGGGGYDSGWSVAVDGAGRAYVAGITSSSAFPTVNPHQSALSDNVSPDAFLSVLSASGRDVLYSTFLGGTLAQERPYAVAVDDAGAVALAGASAGSNFPATPGALFTSPQGPVTTNDSWVAVLHPGLAASGQVASFFLPTRVNVHLNAKDSSKSTLVAAGVFDTGPVPADFASGATIAVGGLSVNAAAFAPKGKGFAFAGNGLAFRVTPNAYGSSKAKFQLKYTGNLNGKVAAAGPLALHFTNASADGGCSVTLGGGVFGLGKVRCALLAPSLYLAKAKATLKGPGKDALSITAGLADVGGIPPAASDVTIGFGTNLSTTILAASFVRKGNQYVFAGKDAGITRVVIDYARETITIGGKSLDLGSFAQGGNAVQISVGLGGDARAVSVRMGRKGATMKY